MRIQMQDRDIGVIKVYVTHFKGQNLWNPDWLRKALELAKEFSPDSYSVSIGIPIVGTIGFTWKLKQE